MMRRRKQKNKRFAAVVSAVAAVTVLIGAIMGISSNRRSKYYVLSRDELTEAVSENVYETNKRKTVAESALSLVGRVHYFWGGKCYMQGEDPDWGSMRIVSSEGHSSSGTVRQYGLDCSGFVSWCFIQLGYDRAEMEKLVGSGTWNQWNKSEPISKKEMKIGDIAFIKSYPGAKGSHIGICVGFFKNGEPLIAHCSYTENNVVVSTCGDMFRFFRRPAVFPDAVNTEKMLVP